MVVMGIIYVSVMHNTMGNLSWLYPNQEERRRVTSSENNCGPSADWSDSDLQTTRSHGNGPDSVLQMSGVSGLKLEARLRANKALA